MRKTHPDEQMVRRAARTVAWQTAVAVTSLVLLMGVALLVVEQHQQDVQAVDVSRQAWASADDLTDPPPGVWLVVSTAAGARRTSAGAPASSSGIDPRRLTDGAASIGIDGRDVEVFTGDRRIGRVSAVFDRRADELERQRLEAALLVAALVGVLGSLLLGAIIGRRAVRPLGSALALQRRFVADASHELRTPLTVLHTRAQLVRRHLRGQVDQASAVELDQLVVDAGVLGEVVSDLLVAAEAGGRNGGGLSVDLSSVADAVVESMRGIASERGVTLQAAHGDGSTTVLGAAVAIRRAVSSLVDNALAHTPPGGHVRIEVEPADDAVVVTVVDDGEGLDPATAGQLVQRFARGAGTAGTGRRFGIGLALVDEVARAHGGSLLVDGEPGRGARVGLRLPRSGS